MNRGFCLFTDLFECKALFKLLKPIDGLIPHILEHLEVDGERPSATVCFAAAMFSTKGPVPGLPDFLRL